MDRELTRPLTRSQTLIWTGQVMAGQASLYNQAWRFDLRGPQDPQRFTRAFELLAKRTDALRTVIVDTEDGPRQRVLGEPPAKLKLVDLTAQTDIEAAARQWIAEHIETPFDLSVATYETALLKCAEDHWIWYFCQHHILTDAWCGPLLYSALRDCYLHLDNLAHANLAPLPAFADYVEEEATQRASSRGEQAKAFWRERTLGPSGRAPLYSCQNNGQASPSERITIPLGPGRSSRLAALIKHEELQGFSSHHTQFQLYACALMAFLARVSGQQRICIGAPVSNRPTSSYRSTVGLFVELFPLTIVVEENETFRSLFHRIGREQLQLMRHMTPGASSAKTARQYNVVLNYIHAQFRDERGLLESVEWLPPCRLDAGHDVHLQIFDFLGDGAPVLAFDINKNTIPANWRASLPRHFLTVLDALLDDFDRRIDDFALVGLEDRTSQRHEDEAHRSQKPAGETLISLYEEQAALHSQAVAVRDEGVSYSYASLDQRAKAIAEALVQRGVTEGSVVGLHLRRSYDYVASVLAVMKVGAIFAPLDATMPSERLNYILQSTSAAAVVTQEVLAAELPVDSVPVLVVEAISQAGSPTVLPGPRPTDGAYIIHTSGSTGVPKGVLVGHREIADYASWALESYGSGRPTSMPFFTAIGFDLTLTSLFVPLISGGTVSVYREPEHGPDLSVLRVFADDDAGVVKLTPSHLSLALETAKRAKTIRALILGGEDLPTALVRSAESVLGGHVAIYNEYGPTEAVVGCMIHCFDRERDRGASVPIGVAAPGAEIHVLDKFMHPVPDGVVGEIYIGGRHLAQGYWQEKLGEGKFVDDPFRETGTLYRTGDLARVNERGVLEYLGRNDDQVKIRGVRIETAEIAETMKRHPLISDAFVIVHEVAQTEVDQVQKNPTEIADSADDRAGEHDRRLVGYVIANDTVDLQAVRSSLRQHLLDEMIPSHIIRVDRFPLTPNGKIDRSALPKPSMEVRPTDSATYIGPRDDIEEVLARCWSEVLEIDPIGIHDNFYDLGGDSIAAIRIAARAQTSGLVISPTQLFQHQTIATLRPHLERELRGSVVQSPTAPGSVPGLDSLDEATRSAIAAALSRKNKPT